MHQYGSNTDVGQGQYPQQQQQQQQYSAQYNQYSYPQTQFSGHQQPSTGYQYQATNQHYDNQSGQYSQPPWSGQQHQAAYQQDTSAGYNSNQGQGFQNGFQQNSNPNTNNNPRNRHPPQASQNCYNCGGADHWAQNCPEPRRANPAGAVNDYRPAKRQKTNGPIVTRYPPPPNYQQRGPHRGYTHPPPGHAKGNQHNNYPSLQNPVSATSYTSNQWQQQSPVQQSPQSQHSVPSTPWAQQGAQIPASQSGSPNSPAGVGNQNSFSPSASGEHLQGSEFNRNSYDFTGKLSRHSSQVSEHGKSTTSRKGDPDGPFFAVDQLEPWMEELQALDIPDQRSNSSAIVWHPPNPVAQALASTAFEADAVGRLPIAASLPPGVPISKYFQNRSSEEIEQPVQYSSDWQEVKFDPVFAPMVFQDSAVPLSVLIARRNARREHTDESAEANIDSRTQYYKADSHQTTVDPTFASLESQVRRDETSAPWQDKGTASNSQVSEEESRIDEREEKLAALGVTGPSRPIRTASLQTKTEPERSNASSYSPPMGRTIEGYDNMRDADQSFRGYENNHHTVTQPSAPLETRRKESKEKHVYTEAQEALQGFPTEDSDESQSIAPSPGDYRAPNGLAQSADGQTEHSTSDLQGANYTDTNGHQELQNVLTSPNEKGKSTSPLNSRLTPTDSKKRSFRETSEDSDGGQKRQQDDTGRRLKRRQPQVAEAYGRRW